MRKLAIVLLIVCLVLPAVISASSSDFEIVTYSIYGNKLGDSWAKVTVKNVASGSRIIESDDFAGHFADGSRKRGMDGASISVKPDETAVIMVSFERYKWPLESVSFY